MATEVPQRALRNETAALLRRVQAGERLRVTVHGHPVAELGPLESGASFAAASAVRKALDGLLAAGDPLERELREVADEVADPFS